MEDNQEVVAEQESSPSEPQEPNIIATKDKKHLNAEGKPHPSVTIGGHGKFELPDADTQWKGFHHPEADKIIACFPDLYKRPEPKG